MGWCCWRCLAACGPLTWGFVAVFVLGAAGLCLVRLCLVPLCGTVGVGLVGARIRLEMELSWPRRPGSGLYPRGYRVAL